MKIATQAGLLARKVDAVLTSVNAMMVNIDLSIGDAPPVKAAQLRAQKLSLQDAAAHLLSASASLGTVQATK